MYFTKVVSHLFCVYREVMIESHGRVLTKMEENFKQRMASKVILTQDKPRETQIVLPISFVTVGASVNDWQTFRTRVMTLRDV